MQVLYKLKQDNRYYVLAFFIRLHNSYLFHHREIRMISELYQMPEGRL